jgi:hypothetical protein
MPRKPRRNLPRIKPTFIRVNEIEKCFEVFYPETGKSRLYREPEFIAKLLEKPYN